VYSGNVSANETIDRLESVGIKTIIQQGVKDRLIIDKVRLGSAAYYKGVSEGDEIASVKPSEAGFNLTFMRAGRIYQVFLQSQLVPRQNSPAETAADRYLQEIEKEIGTIQQKRIAEAEEERTAPERAKKMEKEAMKNETTAKIGESPVSKSEIEKSGGSVIKQAAYPNCWFEAALAAVIRMPHGHELIAGMMKKTGEHTFRVTFPGDKKYIEVNSDDLRDMGVHDKALWARILDCGCLKKFPGNEGVSNDTGIRILTGMPTYYVDPSGSPAAEIASILDKACSQRQPMIMGTSPESRITCLPANHAFTVLGFDKNSGVVTLQNPWNGDPLFFKQPDLGKTKPIGEAQGVRDLGNGIVQVSLDAVTANFNGICWAKEP
jgi:hypothetical protein